MIRIRNIDGGTWKNVNRREAIEYACKYVFKGEERNLRRLGFFELKYFNKKLLEGIVFTGKELRCYIHRKLNN